MIAVVRKTMTRWPLIAAGLCFALASMGTQALPEDRDQPIRIQSDRAEQDQKTGVTTYSGDVIIDQGTLHIEAEQVVIETIDDQVSLVIANGNPARMEQQLRAEKGPVRARGKTIKYNVELAKLTLLEDAFITQQGSSVQSKQIDYYVREERFHAEGDPESTNSRVQMIIPPRQANETLQNLSADGDTESE